MSNQSPFYVDHNAFESDGALTALVCDQTEGLQDDFREQGRFVASREAQELARLANSNKPVLRTVDAKGERVDVVEFHPAYHALMRHGKSIGLGGSIWEHSNEEAGSRNLARAVRFMLTSQLENGHTCPLTMTNASIAPLKSAPGLQKDWLPKIVSRDYDASQNPPSEKRSLTIGMGMTERQGGSDVRANTTKATRNGDDAWHINGEKWFLSAPMCDAFLVLAQAESGLSCFFIPRLLPDGSGNGFRLQRLKDKLGNHSNASSEIEFRDSLGMLIGEEGKGIRTILDMVTLTRLDCAVGQAGLMRAAFAESVHHCRHRSAFGKKLIDQPLMQRVLADMALDVVAAQALALRLARSFDGRDDDESEAAFARIMTPAVKYWTTKLAPALIYEAMECLGGNGYIEESNLPRYYREAPLNSIWEGSGNIMALDVLRAIGRSPGSFETVLAMIAATLGQTRSQATDFLKVAGEMALEDEGSGRLLTEQLALTAAAAELQKSMPPLIADAFFETRLGRPWRHTYGMLDARYDARQIIDFVAPAVM